MIPGYSRSEWKVFRFNDNDLTCFFKESYLKKKEFDYGYLIINDFNQLNQTKPLEEQTYGDYQKIFHYWNNIRLFKHYEKEKRKKKIVEKGNIFFFNILFHSNQFLYIL